jgi:molecular chaperone GrpE (heat shock protein)
MRTTSYNPSKLEVALTDALSQLTEQLNSKLGKYTVESIKTKTREDNPSLVLSILDEDNDPHTVVVKIIQRPDNF